MDLYLDSVISVLLLLIATHACAQDPSMASTPGWKDSYGDGCEWYENNDSPGCPSYGNDFDGGMGVANDNCSYCASTGSPAASAYSLVVFSDPQIGYHSCQNGTGCIFTGAMTDTVKEYVLEESIKSMISSAQDLISYSGKDYRGIVMNGDMVNTNNDGTQGQKFQQLFATDSPYSLGPPLFLGLGNHDSYCDDCTGQTMRFYNGYIDKLKISGEIRDLDGLPHPI
mmetsp:Transcript_25744/g.54405  ORF Transcript_25744/g.54405 Transcript_25744/m.54405 type:complete len:226 (-) Transcript_25744:1228-1905(-)